MRVHLLVEPELRVRQVQAREQRVLVEQEVADRRAAEHVELAHSPQLVHALEQERELGRKREASHVLVEALEERIVLGPLEQFLAVDSMRELPGKAGLAGADRPFDDDVAAFGEVHRPIPAPLMQDVRTRAHDALAPHRAEEAARQAASRHRHGGADVGQRPKHEGTLVHSWVRQGQSVLPDAAATV